LALIILTYLEIVWSINWWVSSQGKVMVWT